MTYQIALQFEDGVTRIIPCAPGELVCDAAYRARINIPLDCRDGACGTCKAHCESGTYELGAYIDDAMTAQEAAEGGVLTCQMRPTSDCLVRVPASSAACKTAAAAHEATLVRINRDSPTTVTFTLEASAPLDFLPGQYVNLQVPGCDEHRAYSFSSAPGSREASFLIRDVPDGLMSAFMRHEARPGMPMRFTGPYGSFYLRPVQRPVLMLAGGTGLAPFLSMLRWLAARPATGQRITLAYGVNGVADLVELEALDALRAALPGFDYFTVVVDAASGHPRTGYVTDHLGAAHLHAGECDVYVCGPPPMVEGVRRWIAGTGVTPRHFLFEKFTPASQAAEA